MRIKLDKSNKTKIMVWLGNNPGYFGITKKILEKYPCELFGIIDHPENSKRFFENQKMVKFTKKWYLRDEIQEKEIIDYDYLELFEKKYKISLWQIIYSDRFFNKYNKYHLFTEDEIFQLVQNECKFFERVLDDINPDFVIIKMTESHQDYLFHEICLAKKIRILTAGAVRFSGRTIISSEVDKMDVDFEDFKVTNEKVMGFEELQNYMKGYSKDIKTLVDKSGITTSSILRLSLKYLKMFSSKGKTPLQVILKITNRSIRKWNVQRYLKKHTIKKISDQKFIYFPLHYEPERNISIGAPFYENQIEVIANIAKALPVKYKLFVKDHPLMEKIGMRDISSYKKINDFPNVELVSKITSEELLKKCSLLITVAGTSGLEAAFYGKPSIVFSDVVFEKLPSVFRVRDFEELPNTIKLALEIKM